MQNRIKKGRQIKSHLICLYAESKMGKSTFASQSPSPLFLEPSENGSFNLDVARTNVQSWAEADEMCRWFLTGDHEYKTLVIDTIDWLQALLFKHICEEHKTKSIELAAGGFGKGYVAAFEKLRGFIDLLTEIRNKGFNVIILAHAKITDHANPTTERTYAKYDIALHESAKISLRNLVREYVDSVLFVQEKVLVAGDGKNARGVSVNKERRMYTSWDPGFYAGSRYNIPFELPFSRDNSWNTYVAAVDDSFDDKPEVIIERIGRLIPNLKENIRDKVQLQLTKAGSEVELLKALDKRVRLSIGENA